MCKIRDKSVKDKRLRLPFLFYKKGTYNYKTEISLKGQKLSLISFHIRGKHALILS